MTESEKAVMQMALDWMNNHGGIVFAGGGMNAVDPMNKAAQALREAIAQPEQPTLKTLTGAAQQSWEFHLQQATDIRELLDLHAPKTEGNLHMRLVQVFAQPEQTTVNLEKYLSANYPDAKGETLAERVIDALETMDIALGMKEIAQPEQPAIHDSDCSMHNGPAFPAGLCDCRLATEEVRRSVLRNHIDHIALLEYKLKYQKESFDYMEMMYQTLPMIGVFAKLEDHEEVLSQPVQPHDKLLQIIAAAYQIAGACDVPAHILDVLANPEQATQGQIDAMLPFVQTAQEPNAWRVSGTNRLYDQHEAEQEAKHCGGSARAYPVYAEPFIMNVEQTEERK